jgi:hypothetical protein
MATFSTASMELTPMIPSPTVCSIPDLPIPSVSPSCEEEWKRAAALNSGGSCVVYGLAWQEQHLVAVTSTGQVCIWKVPTIDDDLDEVEELEIFQQHCHALVK